MVIDYLHRSRIRGLRKQDLVLVLDLLRARGGGSLAASFARRFKNQLCSVKLLEPVHEFVRIESLAPSCSLACHILCSSAEGTGEVDVEPGLLLGLLEINLEKYG